MSETASPGDHRLAIIIDDCGQWPQTERALIALPIAITISVMPKERYTKEIAQAASDAGKGIMLHLPMEPVAAIDPGPGKITTEMSDAEVAAQVKEDVALVPLAKGVNNHEGSKASSDVRVMRDVVSVLAPTGLFFIDSRTSAQSVAAQIAAEGGMKTASRDVFLDNEDNVDAIEKMLRTAASVALKSGSAIAIGHPRAATLQALRALIPELQSEGITFTLALEMVH
ncbi:MAG: divergent polysaccharide deacetylase family protein [Candidatus Baltobacteraceae bacterium]